MKKLLLCLFASAMLISTTVCAEETEVSTVDIDLKNMTSEELLSLKKAVISEINSRDELVEIIPQGTYVTGVDIKEGDYLLTAKETKSARIKIFNSEEDYNIYVGNDDLEREPTIELKATLRSSDDSVMIHLKENNVLCVEINSVTIASADDDKPSWAP